MLNRLLMSALSVLSLLSEVHAEGTAAATADPVEWQWGVKVPLRDGIKLNATLYRGRDQAQPQPCLFAMTPYIAATYHDRGLYFAARGYVVLVVDVRGRGNSEGEFAPFRQEARDGSDVVKWLAAQPYCNGKIAMWGGSYGGYDQWMTAGQDPTGLATIVPVAAPFFGVDIPRVGNIMSAYIPQWLSLVSGRTLQQGFLQREAEWKQHLRDRFVNHRPFAELERFAAGHTLLLREWLAHTEVDAYWDEYNLSAEQYGKVDMPVLTITGQFDGDQPGALEHYRRHLAAAGPAGAQHFLVIGPWDHGQTRTPKGELGGLKFGAASVIDIDDLHRQWYDWTLKGRSRPEFLQQRVAYYVTGEEAWRYAESLESVTREQRVLYLGSAGGSANDVFHSGSLREQRAGGDEPDSYVYDPLDVSSVDLQMSLDSSSLIEQRDVLLAAGKSLVYHSAPLQQDTRIAGFFRLRAFIEIDRPDTDFSVKLYEVTKEGGSVALGHTIMRARYRDSLRQAKPVPLGKVIEYRFDSLPFVARQLARGSRLRLVFGPINSMYQEKNYNSGGVVARESAADARTVVVKLHHDAKHPSALYVPIAN